MSERVTVGIDIGTYQVKVVVVKGGKGASDKVAELICSSGEK